MPQCLQPKFLWVSTEMQLLWGTDTDTLCTAEHSWEIKKPCLVVKAKITVGSSERKNPELCSQWVTCEQW